MKLPVVPRLFVWPAIALLGACSFGNTDQIKCTSDTDCAPFGSSAVCTSDGFCSNGSSTGDAGGDDADEGAPHWNFVSFPDWLNADIGDVSALTTVVNSDNAAQETAINTVLDALEAEHPDFVLVAGDEVNGHWYLDADNVHVFGQVDTIGHKIAAVQKGAATYYPIWKKRFADRGLQVYAAVGDHDIGDNNWAAGTDKATLVDTYKQAWAQQFTLDSNGQPLYAQRPVGTPWENTAYAVQHKNVLVVSTDVFHQEDPATALDPRTGSVRCEVVDEQVAWLDSLLTTAAADPTIQFVLVQGHVPVLLPVRAQNSSNLSMAGAEASPFWQTLVQHKVSLYLAGEVHAMSAAENSGVEQVVHGGIMGYGAYVSYLVGHVYSDHIDLELKSANLVYDGSDTTRLWQAGPNRPHAQYTISPDGFTSAGKLTVTKVGGATTYSDPTGYFMPISSGTGLVVHLPFDETGGTTAVNHGTSGADNNGSITGATFVPGKIGNGLSFETVDRVVAGSAPIGGAGKRTVSVWVNTPPGATAIRTVLSFGKEAGGQKWDTDIDISGWSELGIGLSRTDGSGSPVVNDGQWHHLVAVLPDGEASLGQVLMYVDGNPIAFTAPSAAVNTQIGGQFIIGSSVHSINFQEFTGTVDDVAIWAEDLDAARVRALYTFGNEPTVNYDAGQMDEIFTSFDLMQDVTINGRLWTYQASGLTGTPGTLVVSGTNYAVNLGNGAGMVSSGATGRKAPKKTHSVSATMHK